MEPLTVGVIVSITSILCMVILASCACCHQKGTRTWDSDPYLPVVMKKHEVVIKVMETAKTKSETSSEQEQSKSKEAEEAIQEKTTMMPVTAVQMTIITPDPHPTKTPSTLGQGGNRENAVYYDDPAYRTFGADLDDPFKSSRSARPFTLVSKTPKKAIATNRISSHKLRAVKAKPQAPKKPSKPPRTVSSSSEETSTTLCSVSVKVGHH